MYTCRIIESSSVFGTRLFHHETRDCTVNRLMSRENVHSRERHANLLECDLLWKLAIPRRIYCKGSVENVHSTEDKNVPIGRDVIW